MLPELTTEEYSAALDAVVAELLENSPLERPPVNTLALAQSLGLSVAWDDAQQGRGRVVRLGGFGGGASHSSILLRPDPRRERLQWAIAHEIGETCAVDVFGRLGIDPREAPPGAREKVANALAGRLLLPREWFLRDARRCHWDLFELKAHYATASHELIARRMLDFEPPIIITIFDHGRRGFRRANFSGRLPALLPVEQTAWAAAHEGGLPAGEEDHQWRAQAWPVHEPDWKREILRCEWLAADEDHF